MTIVHVAAALFSIGLYGVLTRRDLVAVLCSIEVMLGGALVLLIGLGATSSSAVHIEGIGLMVLVVAAAEAAVGLALLVAVSRRIRTTRIDELTEVRD